MSNAPVSMSLVENATGMGHYKGVMLSNRPFGGSVAVNKAPPAPNTFACRVVPSQVGLNVPVPLQEKMIKRPKKDSVLVKHKKWLNDLQKTKERLEQEFLDEAQRKEEEKRQFQERERQMRELSRSILQTDDKAQPETTSDAKETTADAKESGSVKKPKAGAKSLANLPAWAVSEEKAEALAAAKQEAEEEDLLTFALGLDYDRIVSDVEVQSTLQRLTKRIGELEREAKDEEDRERDVAERAARREMLAMMAAAQASLQANGALSSDSAAAVAPAPGEAGFLAYQHARALLDAAERDSQSDAKHVHSTKSISTLLQAAKEKIAEVASSYRQRAGQQPSTEGATVEQRIGEPKIVVHEPNEGTRLEQKAAIANLPYMHRNPSV